MVMRNRRYQEIEKGYSRLDSKAAMQRILTEDLDGRDGAGGPRADDRGVREILRDAARPVVRGPIPPAAPAEQPAEPWVATVPAEPPRGLASRLGRWLRSLFA